MVSEAGSTNHDIFPSPATENVWFQSSRRVAGMEPKIWTFPPSLWPGERRRGEPNKNADLRYGRSSRRYFDLLQTFHVAAETISHRYNEVWWTLCGSPKCYFWASKVQSAPPRRWRDCWHIYYSAARTRWILRLRNPKGRDDPRPTVVGLQDSKLSEKLQLDPELSLAKAINHARQSEAVKKQQALLRNDFKDSEDSKKNVDAVKVTRKNPPKLKDENGPKPKKTPLKKPPSQTSSTRCERCGHLPPHKRANCPAKDATCFKCSKRGHWGTVCKSSKTVGEVEEDENLFLGEIGTETNNTFWQ